jgi:hypothetical protein
VWTINISYAEAVREFPDAIKDVLKQIKPTSQAAKKKPEELKWTIQWGETIKASSFGGIAPYDKLNTIEDKLAFRLSQCSSYLYATCKANYCVALPVNPKKLIEKLREHIEKETAERKRVESLTPEQCQAETEDLLKQLRGQPGFLEVMIPARQFHNGSPENEKKRFCPNECEFWSGLEGEQKA